MSRRPSKPNAPASSLAGPRFVRRVFLALGGLFVAPAAAIAESGRGYQVIVHPSNPLVSAERTFLADVFLKKRTSWPNDVRIHPVDLRRKAPPRQDFSRDVLRRSVDAVRQYWLQRIFSGGDVPPPEVDSDAAAVEYVAKRAGAVGYVSLQAELRGVRVLRVL